MQGLEITCLFFLLNTKKDQEKHTHKLYCIKTGHSLIDFEVND